jgi:hypothetical protein
MSDFHDDITLTCIGCNTEFVWTKGAQQFYAERQLSAPKRCSLCAKARRAEIEARQPGGGAHWPW